MSRRKQDRPQQWRRNFAEDEEGDKMLEGDEAPSHFDLIKCGDCQADYALSDIVRFIEHKRRCPRTCNGSITSEDPPTLQLITKDGVKEEIDIVSPIAATPTANGTADIKREDGDESKEMETAMLPMPSGNIVRTEKPKIITPIKPRRMSSTSSHYRDTNSPRVKTQTNSTQSEPVEADNLICLTCKEPYESASALLQHVQEDHGMHIYHQPMTPKPPTTPESSRASVEPRPPSEAGSHFSTSSNKPPSLPSPFHPHMPPPPMPVHSPHHFPPHLDGGPFGMFLPRVMGMERSLPYPPPDRMFPGPLNPMLVREMIHNEHHFHMHPPMPQHPPHQRLPPPPPPPPTSSPSPMSTSSDAGLSGIDIYSRKLQELATGGPPLPPPQNRPMSPKKRPFHYPMFHQSRNFKSPFPPKGKACEFCGKSFKFQSNLIVHRRSHTGEKPYKCHLCDHACSQASKLKRHMKTHKKISPSTVAPPMTSTDSCSPLSDTQDDGSASNILKSVAQYITDTKSSGGNTSDEDEGDCELEEEEAEERATMEREEMERERERERGRERELGREREHEKENGVKGEHDLDQDMENSELDMPMGKEASDFPLLDSRKDKEDEDGPASLLSEVMKHTGLGEIQQYSEAFRQAVAENRERNNSFCSNRSPSTEDGESDKDASRDGEDPRSPTSISQHSPSIGQRSPSIEHRSPSLGQRSPTGSHLDHPRHPSTSPPSLHNSFENHFARLQEVEQSLHPSHHIESTSAMRELEIVAKRIKVEPTSPCSWVQTATATDSAALPRPRSDPYMFTHTNENSPTGATTNGNLCRYYRHPHENGPTPLPGLPRYSASLGMHHHHHHKPPKGQMIGGGPRRNDQCEYCGKIFKNCSNLTVHRRSHTGEKPYKCNLCSYACAQSSKLTRHMKTHGQGAKEVFKCEVCGMPFSVYSTLEKHMKKSHWGAIKGTAPKPEPIHANAYPTPHKSTSPTQFSPVLSPNM